MEYDFYEVLDEEQSKALAAIEKEEAEAEAEARAVKERDQRMEDTLRYLATRPDARDLERLRRKEKLKRKRDARDILDKRQRTV